VALLTCLGGNHTVILSAFMKPQKYPGQIYCWIAVSKGRYARGYFTQLHPTNLTYSTQVMPRKVL